MTFEKLIADWHDGNWPGRTDIEVTAKIGEEVGEVQGATIKLKEGRRTEKDLQDEMGDVLITLSVLAGRFGWQLDNLREKRFEEVVNR